MLNGVKLLVSAVTLGLLGRGLPRPGSPLAVSLLDATPSSVAAGQATAALAIELLAAGATEPPDWVCFLAPGPNRVRDGRGPFIVEDVDQVVRLSTEYKGSIDLLIDFEHQFDRAPTNGQPAPAAAWIKELSAKGPDGTPGVWARVDWLPDTAALIRARKYRYLSAAIGHDDRNVVRFVARASLTNHPAVDTATALFSADTNKEHHVTLLQKLLAALGIAATTTEEQAVAHVGALATLAAALAKQMGVELAVLSAMTAEQLTTALTKPLADKIATLSASAKLGADATPDAIVAALRGLGVDPTTHVARSVYDDVAGRLATLTADLTTRQIEEARKAGKLTPAMEPWAKTLSPEQLTAFLATAAVIVAPGADPARPALADGSHGLTVAQLAVCKNMGLDPKAYAEANGISAT